MTWDQRSSTRRLKISDCEWTHFACERAGYIDSVSKEPPVVVAGVIGAEPAAEAHAPRPRAHSGDGIGPAAQLIQLLFSVREVNIVDD